MNLIVGDKIKLDIRKQGINGEGIGYHNQTLVFVPGAILKEQVYCEIKEVKKTFAIGEIIKITRTSTKRVEPPCKYYNDCGGCQMQHIDYLEQLKIKQSIIKQALKKYTKMDVDAIPMSKTIGMEYPYKYRNKSQMPFRNTNFGLALGFYKPESNQFVYVEECMGHHNRINEINRQVLKVLRKHKMKAHDKRNQEGTLQYLVTRYFERTHSASVTFVVNKYTDILKLVSKDLQKEVPFVKSISYTISNPKSNLVISNKSHLIDGETWIEGYFKDFKIKVSPDAFHQLNTIQMEALYDAIVKKVDFTPDSVVFDLYSGIGITSLLFAKLCKKVYGIDYSHASIKDAMTNTAINDIDNVEFITGHVEVEMPKLIKSGVKPNLVVLDPPRKGIALPVVEALLKAKPKQIAYISCNPSTLAKNINDLSDKYAVQSITPIDMFPNTAAVESITMLKLK